MNIGIFTAMKKESESFLKFAKHKICVGNFEVFQLEFSNHNVFLCCPPTIGEICAAAACQLLISQFQVEVVLNFGVVGALTPSTATFSNLYVQSVVHAHRDLSEVDNVPVGYYDCFDSVLLQCDNQLLQKARQVQELPQVCCASSDKFIATPEEKQRLHSQFGADICDMESAAIVVCCRANNIPCLLVKCVSDSLTEGSDGYRKNAERAAENFFEFAQRLVAKL